MLPKMNFKYICNQIFKMWKYYHNNPEPSIILSLLSDK